MGTLGNFENPGRGKVERKWKVKKGQNSKRQFQKI